VRRITLLAALAVAVGLAGTADGAVKPILESLGVPAISQLRPSPVVVTPPTAERRTRVIVTLDPPPLAELMPSPAFIGGAPRRKIDFRSPLMESALTHIEAAQRVAIARIHEAVPGAIVSRRFQVLVDGITVSVPYDRLPQVLNLPFVQSVYPSLRYTLDLNKSTSVIGAPQLSAATGDRGQGVKIAIVDDGIDEHHPFLDPAGYSYPPGFPKGITGSTTPKVIVARGFPGPRANGAPLDRDTSFHGTFVAGVVAGDAGTNAPASDPGQCGRANGGCHPAVDGLSGVAPRAWLGNYRVFNTPLPFGGCCVANSPEIVAAFEAAVKDGMDIINFSGGGPQIDPSRDILMQAITNVVRAGVLPVISAGNDRDFFGLGTVGSPSTAPEAMSVAADTNAHVFGEELIPKSPSLGAMPFAPAGGDIPASWETSDQKLVDVGSIKVNGQPVDRLLCSASPALPPGSLRGEIALVTRGGCTFSTKASRAGQAGAIGLVVADDQPGDPSGTPVFLGLDGGVISELDGARLRAALASSGGVATVRFDRGENEIPTTWAGTPASYSAGGLTPFGHLLKPDISAPGSQIISSTLPEFAGDQYAVLDGTSFSAPHISGAAALLLERHPTWGPMQLKSALMSTAGPALGDATGTAEAPVLVEGAGLARVGTADNPLVFTDPQSLSFGDLDAAAGSTSQTIPVTVTDAGNGAGTWDVELQPQSVSSGATVDAAPVTLAPGGSALLQVVARASSGAAEGVDYGFLLLRRGSDVRRIPYAFSVGHSKLASEQVVPLKTNQSGDTRVGQDLVQAYRWPTAPFSVAGLFGADTTLVEDGKEHVYSLALTKKVANAGVVVLPAPRVGAPIESLLTAPIAPFFLHALDENTVLGYAGTPINANGDMPDFLFGLGVAGADFPAVGTYYVVVDSGHDPFTGKSTAGPYVLHSWVNDVTPPRVQFLTTRVSAGYPTFVVKVTDSGSGVDGFSIQLLLTRRPQLGASSFDPATGIAVLQLPRSAIAFQPGPQFVKLVASDYQESKNVDTEGENPFPNTTVKGARVQVVSGPAVTWIMPNRGACLAKRTKLLVVANDDASISSVGFFDGARQIGRVRKNTAGLFALTWNTAGRRRGPHVLTAVASDTRGREDRASRPVRICG
jgi:subtilisin family serine protease